MKRILHLGFGLLLIISSLVGIINLMSDDVKAPTFVSGTVYDGFGGPWTPGGSPYIVVGDVTVPTLQFLTIQPGTQVKFDGYWRIVVNGILMAEGTATNRINITSNMAVPAPGDWDRIIASPTGHVVIRFCAISYGSYGIYIDTSGSHTIMNNTFTHNFNFGVRIYFSSGGNIIRNNKISWTNGGGIGIHEAPDNFIINNTLTYNEDGIGLTWSNGNTISDNNFSSNGDDGIWLGGSSNNIIANNNIASNNDEGIWIFESSDNKIMNNSITSNAEWGIDINSHSYDNVITNNTVLSNGWGIYMKSNSNNKIYHNRIINNVNQSYDDGSTNFWNETYPTGGNYWSDWSPTCQDLYDGAITPQTGGGGPDGICDLQYDIDADSADYYPLVKPPTPQPPYITDLKVLSTEINITWTLSPSNNANAYDVYGGLTQTSIDFNAPLFSTSDEGAPAAQCWAQFPFDIAGNPEYYFVVRARNNTLLERSSTSNTVGYYRLDFDAGLNTFSLPLEPFTARTLDYYVSNIPSATSISWLDDNDDWWTYPSNPLTPQAKIGEGYVLNLTASSDFVFTGQPASMIIYKDGFGFDGLTRDDISASVDPSGDITVSWTPILGAEYYIYWSTQRDGFHTGMFTILNGGLPVAGPPFVHVGAASSPGEDYYMVVPYDPVLGLNGSSTYSIGVFTAEFNGNEMFGLPLKPVWGSKSADWFVEQVPNSQGIVFLENGEWRAHFKSFPEGIYDTIIEYGRGYELSVYATSRYSFVGC